MLSDTDNFYLEKSEPEKSCLIALRDIILQQDSNISQAWKYKMPFFCYKGKMFCYLWVRNKTSQPYIGLVDGNRIHHQDLISEKRLRMKIMLVDPAEDLPVDTIKAILQQAIGILRND